MKELEHSLRQAQPRQRELLADRALKNQVEVLGQRVQEAEREARWRDTSRKVAAAEVAQVRVEKRKANDEANMYKRRAELESCKVTAMERSLDAIKRKNEHNKIDLKSGAEERSVLAAERQQHRQEIQGTRALLARPAHHTLIFKLLPVQI